MDELASKYLQIREKKQELVNQHKEKVAQIDAVLAKLEIAMLEELNDAGIESARTKAGTVYKTTQKRVGVADWDTVLEFIRQNEYWTMLERRVNKTAVEQWETEEGALPPGLNIHSEIKVNVRRS